MNLPLSDDEMKSGCRLGIDSHADTSCVNKHVFIENVVDGMTVDAVPFDGSLGKACNLSIVHAIFAIDNPITFRSHLMRISNSIHIPNIEQALLCPNQARSFGTIIDDIPPDLDHTGASSFSVQTTDPDETSFPLSRFGPTSYLPVRRPTQEELETLPVIDITEEEEWDPYKNTYSVNTVEVAPEENMLKEDESDNPIGEHLLYGAQRKINAMKISKPKSKLTPECLSEIWNCGMKTARKTIQATTCKHCRNINKGLTRRFRPSRNFMRYQQIALPAGQFFTDTFHASVKSVRGFTCAQVFGNRFGFIKAYPLESHNKEQIRNSLSLMMQDVGIVQKLHADNAPEMVGRKTPFFRRSRKEGIDLTTIEPERPNENFGEVIADIVKLVTAKLMSKRRVPMRLWCYAMEYYADLYSLTAPGMHRNKGRTGYEIACGLTPDISEYIEFQFYSYCWHWDTPQSFPHEKKHLGRWLGVAHRVGQAMVFCIMNDKGHVIARSTVTSVDPSDYDVDEVKARMKDLDTTIRASIGDYRNAVNQHARDAPDLSDEELDEQLQFCFNIGNQDLDNSDAPALGDTNRPDCNMAGDDIESEAFDKFLGIHIEVPGQDAESVAVGKVIGRKRNTDGQLMGRSNDNPILNTAIYDVQTPDGITHEHIANLLAEHLWNQVDNEGWDYGQIFEVVGHRRNEDAVPKDEGFITNISGTRKRVVTTKGWDMKVRWENGEESCIPLKDIKESNSVEVSEYAVNHNTQDEPAFAWWYRTALKQRKAIIKKVARRMRKRSKFGIEIPSTYAEAVILDRKNGNTLWQDATKKEMNNVEVAFKFLDRDNEIPIGFKSIEYHVIYDVKFDLTRKARCVGGGYKTKVPAAMTYSSVVSRHSVRIMFLVAALNGLDARMCDIGNAHLNAETRERL